MSDSDFDETSRRALQERRARRRNSRDSRRSRLGSTGQLPSRQSTESDEDAPLNPGWRRERTVRTRRRSGPVTSPQELAIWLQKGGWMFVAGGGVVFIGLFIFLLMQGGEADGGQAANPFTPSPTTVVGTNPPPAADPALPAPEPTITPVPPAESPPEPGAAPQGTFFVVVNTGGQGLFLRPEPNTSQLPVATLPEGTRVEQIGEDSVGPNFVWRQVRTPDGQEGWVAVDFLQPVQ